MLGVVLLWVVTMATASDTALQLDYNHQEDWGGVCTADSSQSQSPIDIADCEVKITRKSVLKYVKTLTSINMANLDNVNTVKYKLKGSLTLPNLWNNAKKVKLLQLHLHWGSDDTSGSEHLLAGVQFSAESHLVSMYRDSKDGVEKYMVFARVFSVGDQDNEQVEQMLSASEKKGARKRKVRGFDLTALYPDETEEWFTYNGSFTTPGCDEIASWVVFREPLYISQRQLRRLRSLRLGDGSQEPLPFNWRHAQERHGRKCTLYRKAQGRD